jgi:creatinine amidohydrolase
MSSPDRYRVAELTRDDFAEAMQEGRWLLLPFGAVEQHGPHLPLGTDLFYAEHVCLRVAERVNGLVAPGFPYGICRTMRHFPGTVSVSPETFTPLVREVLAGYVRHGARKIALLAGHAEDAQEVAMREAALTLVDADPSLCVLVIGPYAFLESVRRDADLVGKDGHAGSIETSEMLIAAPDCVHLDRLPQAVRPRLSRFRVSAYPEAEFPSGIRGDTSKVSRALGARAIDHAVEEIARLLSNLDRSGSEWDARETTINPKGRQP